MSSQSLDSTRSPVGKQQKPNPKTLKSGHDDLDARINHIYENVLPKSPYLVSVPTSGRDYAARYRSDNWRIGSPFDKDEEELQYMSYMNLSHSDNLLMVRGGWDDEGSPTNESTNMLNGGRSGTTTPLYGVAKKKITLDAYKKKVASGSNVNGENLRPTDRKPEMKGNDEPSQTNTSSISQSNAKQQGKRSYTDVTVEDGNLQGVNLDASAPFSKKSRLSPHPGISKTKMPIDEEDQHKPNLSLPTLLSPTLPPEIEAELARYEMMSRSQNNQKTGHLKKDSLSSSSSDGNRLKLSKTSAITNRKDKTISRANSKRPESPKQISIAGKTVSKESARKDVDNRPRASSEAKQVDTSKGKVRDALSSRDPIGLGIKIRPNIEGDESSSKKKPPSSTEKLRPKMQEVPAKKVKLIVKLRYGRDRRKKVSIIISKKPQPNISTAESERYLDSETETNRKTKIREIERGRPRENVDHQDHKTFEKINNREAERGDARSRETDKVTPKDQSKDSIKIAPKRQREADDDRPQAQPTKRIKHPETLDLSKKPQTPIPTAFKSPAVSTPGNSAKFKETPKRNIKSVSMRKAESSDGVAKTPQDTSKSQSLQRENNKNDGRPSTSGGTPAIQGGSGNNSWKEEVLKYLKSGKERKREADSCFREDPKNETAAKLGALASIDCILCFMLAFICEAQQTPLDRKAQDNQWRSLKGFWEVTEKRIKFDSILHGFCLQVGAVYREKIASFDLDRLEREPLPDFRAKGRSEEPPTPGTEISRDETDATAAVDNFKKFKSKMVDNLKEKKLLWAAGYRVLSLEILRKRCPETWKAQSHQINLNEKISPGNYVGNYNLPLTSVSSELEAVRLGKALLIEWAKKWNLEWKSKLPQF